MKMKKIVTQQQKKGGSESKAAVKHHLDIWENFKRGIYQDALVRKFEKEKEGWEVELGWLREAGDEEDYSYSLLR